MSKTFAADLPAFLRLVADRARGHRVAQTASSLAFLSLLALVPVAAIGFAVLTVMPAFGDLRGGLEAFFAKQLFPPAFSDQVVRYVNQFATNADRLSALGIAIFVATAVSSLRTIEKTLDEIWAVDDRRPWAQRLALYWMLLTAGPLLAGGSVAVSTYLAGIGHRLGPSAQQGASLWVELLPWLLTGGAVALLYKLLPNAAVRWRDAVLAGAVTGLVLEGLKRVFGWYVGSFANYKLVYGTFAALPAFLLWLFALWLVVLAGAVACANLPRYGTRVDRRDESAAQRWALSADVLGRLVDHAKVTPAPMRASALRYAFQGDAALALRTGLLLERAGYIHRLVPSGRMGPAAVWQETWALTDDPARLTRRRLFDAIWLGNRAAPRARPTADQDPLGAQTRVSSLDSPLA